MDHLTSRYQEQLLRTSKAVRGHVERVWRALPDYRGDNQKLFLDEVLPVVRAGQERAVSLTSAYMSAKLGLPTPLSLPLELLTGAGVRNGVPPSIVYERPFTTLYTSIEKLGYSSAFEKALNRLCSTAEMDVAMSARDASRAFAKVDSNVRGFQRVAYPECCDYCDSIDGAYVRSEDAAPLHNNCRCTVEPVTGDIPADAQWVDVNTTMGDTLIQEHGELGPVITNKDDNFTSKWQLPEAQQANMIRWRNENQAAYEAWAATLTPANAEKYAFLRNTP